MLEKEELFQFLQWLEHEYLPLTHKWSVEDRNKFRSNLRYSKTWETLEKNCKAIEQKHKITMDLVSLEQQWKSQQTKKEPFKNTAVGFIKINEYLSNVEFFHKNQPFFYDRSKIFWFWNKEQYKWEIVDETDLMILIESALGFRGETVTGTYKNGYLEAFRRVGRQNIPINPPKSWVQFHDTIFDLETKQMIQASAKYFICNPIDWKLGLTEETPTLDKLFEEWVGKDYVKTLYEIMAYCCLIDYPIHLVFCLIGSGRNGKSQFQKILAKFLGQHNVTSTELDLLIDNRFETAKLFKKLACQLGETNFGIMKKTSLLKRLCGQDMIGYEFKLKTPFDDYNYAKILINSNSLPSTEDTSEGFYRRWLIIDFPNNFSEGKEIYLTIPEEEFRNLAKKVTTILPELLERAEFTNQGSIQERENKYQMSSNPLPLFLQKACNESLEGYTLATDLFYAYISFLKQIKKRRVKRKEFNELLLWEGLEARRTTKRDDYGETQNIWIVEGVELKEDWEENIQLMQIIQQKDIPFLHRKTNSTYLNKVHKLNKGISDTSATRKQQNIEFSIIEKDTKNLNISEESVEKFVECSECGGSLPESKHDFGKCGLCESPQKKEVE